MPTLTPLEQWNQQVDAIVARFETTPHTYSCDTCHDQGYVYDSGAYTTRDDDKPCFDCRHIGYESSPYGPDGDWGGDAA